LTLAKGLFSENLKRYAMFKKEIYINRRKRLMEKLGCGIVLFLGNGESPMNYPDNTYHFRQDSSFLYFFGLDFPGLAAVLDVESGDQVIFGDDVDINDIIWMGPQESLSVKASRVGVGEVWKSSALGAYIGEAIRKGRRIHFLPLTAPKTKFSCRN